jgi:hypothetical protein
MRILRSLCFLSLALLVLFIPGCGSNNRLQSITISPASVASQGGQAQFTATGVFSNSPMSSMPVAVAWYSIPPAFDPPSQNIGFTRTSQPFMAKCSGFSGVINVTALAPTDAGAPADGTIPLGDFSALVLNHTTTQVDGFVAATAQMTCP